MATHKFSDIQIKAYIVPRRLRWPESGSSLTWTRAHDCVDALQALVRGVDVACVEAEQDRELSAGRIVRRRAELGDQVLRKLVNFRPFGIAEQALSENIVALERLSQRDPEQIQMLDKSKQALVDLREGIEATRRAVLERCRMRERVPF